jgi:hypothetical protein
MIWVDEEAHYKHVQVIRCNIKPELVERSRDARTESISEKEQREYP